jgi:hypothetical protein
MAKMKMDGPSKRLCFDPRKGTDKSVRNVVAKKDDRREGLKKVPVCWADSTLCGRRLDDAVAVVLMRSTVTSILAEFFVSSRELAAEAV